MAITSLGYHKDNYSLDVVIKHMQVYHAGARPDTPTFVAPTHLSNVPVKFDELTFTFSDELLDSILKGNYQKDDLQKDLTTALTYGLIGHSRRKRNGIVNLRKNGDEKMKRRVQEYISKHPAPVGSYYEGVKIVAHHTHGERTIGIHNTTFNRAYFFDRLKY